MWSAKKRQAISVLRAYNKDSCLRGVKMKKIYFHPILAHSQAIMQGKTTLIIEMVRRTSIADCHLHRNEIKCHSVKKMAQRRK